MSDEDWRTVLYTNLSSVFYTCRAAARPMMKRRGGAIVNVIAYKTDYVSATEELKVLDATARKTAKVVEDEQNGGRWWRVATYGGGLSENV